MNDTLDILNEEMIEMTPYRACGIIEGFIETDDENEIMSAWSYIGKTGLYLQLQGSYGRGLKMLIEDGELDENFNIQPFR